MKNIAAKRNYGENLKKDAIGYVPVLNQIRDAREAERTGVWGGNEGGGDDDWHQEEPMVGEPIGPTEANPLSAAELEVLKRVFEAAGIEFYEAPDGTGGFWAEDGDLIGSFGDKELSNQSGAKAAINTINKKLETNHKFMTGLACTSGATEDCFEAAFLVTSGTTDVTGGH